MGPMNHKCIPVEARAFLVQKVAWWSRDCAITYGGTAEAQNTWYLKENLSWIESGLILDDLDYRPSRCRT